MTWTASEGAISYDVYRDGVKIGDSVTTSYKDSGLTAETEYKYQISALNEGGESAKTAEVPIATKTSTK